MRQVDKLCLTSNQADIYIPVMLEPIQQTITSMLHVLNYADTGVCTFIHSFILSYLLDSKICLFFNSLLRFFLVVRRERYWFCENMRLIILSSKDRKKLRLDVLKCLSMCVYYVCMCLTLVCVFNRM